MNLILMFTFLMVGIASIWDLKTSMVPDIIPYLMITTGVIHHSYLSVIHTNIAPILSSLMTGFFFFIISYAMYYNKMWGGADVKILVAVGILLPQYHVHYFINVFLVGLIYSSLWFVVVMKFKTKKKIKIDELKVGDVVVYSKRIDGIKKNEITKLKKSGKKDVVINIGVLYVPVFFIALLVTVVYGNILLALL